MSNEARVDQQDEVQGQTNWRAADKPAVTWGSHATATSAALSRDHRVINHVSETGTGSRQRAMSKDEKEELYRAFLVWQRKQVIDNKRDQSMRR